MHSNNEQNIRMLSAGNNDSQKSQSSVTVGHDGGILPNAPSALEDGIVQALRCGDSLTLKLHN